MNIDIVGKNIEVTEEMKEYVDKHLNSKIGKLLKDFDEDMKNAEFSVEHMGNNFQHKVSFDLWLPGKEHVYAEASNKELLSAIVDLRDKVESQIKEYVGKLNRNKP